MRWFLAPFFGALFLAAEALAQIQPGWSKVAYAPGTITIGGTAQTIAWTFTGPPNGYANLRCVQNPTAASEHLMVAFGSTASATVGQDLSAGSQVCAWYNGATVSIWAQTTGHAFMASEWQY